MTQSKTEIAVFGGGCFWCTEAVFKMFRGVLSVSPGYSGGDIANPTYEQVSKGDTGHAEVIRVEHDPAIISFRTLLTVFFASHDATTLNRQGNDIGTQYRSVIFFTTDTQKVEAEQFIKELNDSESADGSAEPCRDTRLGRKKEGDPIVTEVAPFTVFYLAEDYHENYYERHKDNLYCQITIAPKLQKVQEKFAELLTRNK